MFTGVSFSFTTLSGSPSLYSINAASKVILPGLENINGYTSVLLLLYPAVSSTIKFPCEFGKINVWFGPYTSGYQ